MRYILFYLAVVWHLAPTSSGANGVSIQVKTTNSWPGGAQLEIVVTNNGASQICSVELKLQKDGSTSIGSLWGLDNAGGDRYRTPDYVKLASGQAHTAGAVISGSKIPSYSVISTTLCEFPPHAPATAPTPAPTPAPTSASAPGSGPSYLNQPVKDSIFTFYGASGRGACGLDVSPCSAAGSGDLFNPSAQWVPSTLPDKRYILNDPICKNICIKVEYQGKTGVFPVDNKCPECHNNHVDLSEAALDCLNMVCRSVDS